MSIMGNVFDIQRYSIHDGPGIRTTVFLKGCPLTCKWCSNPESQNMYSEILLRKNKCDRCGKCIEHCPSNLISLTDNGIEIDRLRCDRCMKCVDVCPTHAISSTGQSMTVEEVVAEVIKDELFYLNSGGGVTISGGEPLFQPEFTLALLEEFKNRELHIALDTCGFAEWEILNRLVSYVDLMLFDVKHLDSDQHKLGTGVGNELIFENLMRIAEKRKRVWVRIPIVPGYNDSEQYTCDLIEFLSNMPVEKVSLLGYHEWSRSKYEALGREYPLSSALPVTESYTSRMKDAMELRGLNVTIGY